MFDAARKFALDTNVFIGAARDRARNDELERFRSACAPFEHLSAVVAQELRAGAQSVLAARRLQHILFDPFERRGRVFAPSYSAWKRAGEVLARLAVLERVALRSFGRTFVNDALLAASCREAGVVLLTQNARDFARIRKVMPFEFVAVWP